MLVLDISFKIFEFILQLKDLRRYHRVHLINPYLTDWFWGNIKYVYSFTDAKTVYWDCIGSWIRLSEKMIDNNVHVAHMGPTWVLSAPGGPHVGTMNLAIRDGLLITHSQHYGGWCPGDAGGIVPLHIDKNIHAHIYTCTHMHTSTHTYSYTQRVQNKERYRIQGNFARL